MEEIFTTITLLDGRECSILNIKVGHYYMSSFKFTFQGDNKHPLEAYLMREILIIDGEKRDFDYIDDLSIDDFLTINEVLEAIFAKIPNINN